MVSLASYTYSDRGEEWAEKNRNLDQIKSAAAFKLDISKNGLENLAALTAVITKHGPFDFNCKLRIFDFSDPILSAGQNMVLEDWIYGVKEVLRKIEHEDK